jgi:hypothetical protein
MKKAYNAPKLTNHGNVEEITQAFGSSGAEDVVRVGNTSFPGQSFGLSGSQNGVIVPE